MPSSRKFSQNFHWKILSTFLIVFDVSWEMKSDFKNYVYLQDDEISELGPVGRTTKLACAWHLENLRLHRRQLEIFSLSNSDKTLLSNLMRNSKGLEKLLWICCGRIRQACVCNKFARLSDYRGRSQIDQMPGSPNCSQNSHMKVSSKRTECIWRLFENKRRL